MPSSSTSYPVRADLVRTPLNVLQSWQASRKNLLTIIPEVSTRMPIVSGKTGTPWHMLTDPVGIRRVLLENVENYPKSIVTKNLLRPAIGESLFIAEGKHWRWQRRTAAPAFSHRNVTALAPVMTSAAERSAGRIAQIGNRAVNMLDEMVTATFDVISDVTFSGDRGFDRAAVHRAIDIYISDAGKVSLFDVLGLPDWIPRPGRNLAADGMGDIKAAADRVINARQTDRAQGVPDLLDLLLDGEDPKSGRRMTTEEIRDNLLTFIVAGHETTALTLAWSLYLCAFDPTVQEHARLEAQTVLQGRAATADDVPKLPYIRQIIDEALRLYPPAAIVSRTAAAQDTLCNTQINPGDTVIIPIYALHRSHLLWDDPDRFDPDRWTHGAKPDRYAYLPFGDGPRICIGASFAVQEAVIILATLLGRFRFKSVKGVDPDPVMIITLRPEGGVWLEVEPV
ncbi:MAG: cytochrome P450 [Rhodobacteraceae bacterium]|nr:cytochrome P450 [Paracoccaceae bacterium]